MLGLGKLPPRTRLSCAYWKSPLPGTPFLSSTYVHFNAFWFRFQEECASIISSASLIFVRHMFSHLSNQLPSLCSGSGRQPHWGPWLYSLSFNAMVSQEVPSKLTLSQKWETLFPETSFYCLKLLLKLSRERHTFQGIWSVWLWKWDRSFRPTA